MADPKGWNRSVYFLRGEHKLIAQEAKRKGIKESSLIREIVTNKLTSLKDK